MATKKPVPTDCPTIEQRLNAILETLQDGEGYLSADLAVEWGVQSSSIQDVAKRLGAHRVIGRQAWVVNQKR